MIQNTYNKCLTLLQQKDEVLSTLKPYMPDIEQEKLTDKLKIRKDDNEDLGPVYEMREYKRCPEQEIYILG